MTKNEELARDIWEFLLKHGLWQDVRIYFDGKAFSDREGDNFYYNDPEHLVVIQDIDPKNYMDYVAKDHILSMTFEGPLHEILYWGENPKLKEKFDAIFKKHGTYYTVGDSWNLTCYKAS